MSYSQIHGIQPDRQHSPAEPPENLMMEEHEQTQVVESCIQPTNHMSNHQVVSMEDGQADSNLPCPRVVRSPECLSKYG